VIDGEGVTVGRLLVALDQATEVEPTDVALAWNEDPTTQAAGIAVVESLRPGEFVSDVLALVVIPLGVNLASTAACVLVGKVIRKLRGFGRDSDGDLVVTAEVGVDGDLLVVVRIAAER
jgi:hypothetical protein